MPVLTDEQKDRQRIVSAACRKGNIIICSPRHMDPICRRLIDQVDANNPEWWYDAEQGFVDNFGNFLTRKEAWIVAEKAGQIIHRCGGDGVKLYSENLY